MKKKARKTKPKRPDGIHKHSVELIIAGLDKLEGMLSQKQQLLDGILKGMEIRFEKAEQRIHQLEEQIHLLQAAMRSDAHG